MKQQQPNICETNYKKVYLDLAIHDANWTKATAAMKFIKFF